MHSENNELVKAGHDLAAELGASCGAVDLRDVSKLISSLATQLDCTTAALHGTQAQRDQLAAENVALKSGTAYFSYDSEHYFECHKTKEAAVEAAEAAIEDYRGDACDGWSEEVDSVCWGVIMQTSTKIGERPRTEEDSCDPSINTVCDYALLPNIETPATDAFVAAARAQGVEMFASFCGEENSVFVEAKRYYRSLPDAADEFAEQLRQGGAA